MTENKNAKTPTDGPVAWGCQCGRAYTVTCIASKPLKREWVGLTTDEMKEIADRYHLKPPNIPVAFRAIEAKLKEKNR